MRLVKPVWLCHLDEERVERRTIYSITVNHDGTKVATGSIDSTIKIWSTLPIFDPEADKPSSENFQDRKLLATLKSHLGPVLAVRFANHTNYLASGGDDRSVIIWEFGGIENSHEVWHQAKLFGGHESDVTGLAWSSDDDYLASVGLDNILMIYDTRRMVAIRKIEAHVGGIKGVVWDPVGQYVATQSDDRSVKVWRTIDWECEKEITEPFIGAPKTAIFSRLTWSPDGTHITTPNSMNGPVFVSKVIDRYNWSADISLVGHQDVVDVALFNPLLFLRDPKDVPEGHNLCTLLALGSGNTVSLWLTDRSNPLAVFHNIFERDVLDMAWDKTGSTLYICSSDGCVLIMTFDVTKFAHLAPPGAKESYHATFGFTKAAPQAPVLIQQGLKAPEISMLNRPFDGTKEKKDKKRVPLTNVPRGPEIPVPASSIPNSTNQQAIPPPMVNQPYQPQVPHPPYPPQNVIPPPAPANANGFYPRPPDQYLPQSTSYLQQSPKTTPLKRRASESLEQFHPQPPNSRSGMFQTDRDRMDEDSPANPSSDHLPPPSLGNSKGKFKEQASKTVGGQLVREPPPPMGDLKAARHLDFMDGEEEGYGNKLRIVLAVPNVRTNFLIRHGGMGSASWKEKDKEEGDYFEVRNFSTVGRPSEISLMRGNPKEKQSQKFVAWMDFIPHHVIDALSNELFSIISCENGSIHVYSPTGRRIFPTLLMDSPACFLDACGNYFMAITARGTLQVWDISSRKSVFPPMSILPLLASHRTPNHSFASIKLAKVSPTGFPILVLTCGSAFIYDQNLLAWTAMEGLWWSKGSDFWEGRTRSRKDSQAGGGRNGVFVGGGNTKPVKSLENDLNDILVDVEAELAVRGTRSLQKAQQSSTASVTSGSSASNFDGVPIPSLPLEGEELVVAGAEPGLWSFRQALSLGHLESRMNFCVLLGSDEEFREALKVYAKKLGDDVLRSKADELINDLLGPVYL